MPRPSIFILSDSTGETAERATRSAMKQFEPADLEIRRVAQVRTQTELEIAIRSAVEQKAAVVIHTFVDPAMRDQANALARTHGVRVVDLIGPILDGVSGALNQKPSPEPGLQYRDAAAARTRISAIEFTVKHDDGAGFNTLDRADLVLVGPSRTGKTPLSIYLANNGYRVANVPFITDRPMPSDIPTSVSGIVIGLLFDPLQLTEIRQRQLEQMGSEQQQSRYAEAQMVREEMAAAREYYQRHGWVVLDVTGRAMEEIAVEVLQYLEGDSVAIVGGNSHSLTDKTKERR